MLVLPDNMIGKPVGFTCSTWDLLHAGHILMLAECKNICDYLIVGVQSDPTIDRPETKNKPVQSVVERYVQLSAVKFIDQIIVYDTEKDLEDSIQIHQAWFLLASHSAISLFNHLLDDPEYSKFVNVMLSKKLVTATVIKKQHDYGPENISKFGMWGLIVRLHDKIARLNNLMSTKRKGFNSVSNETIYDTLLDIVGYSTVALLWINNYFFLPMKIDKHG